MKLARLVCVLMLGTCSAFAQGIIATVAGNGNAGSTGDGGPATAATIGNPCGVAVDAAGSFYIADCVNHRIRKINASGIITAVAGTGVAGFSGDGGPATSASLFEPSGMVVDAAGNLYIADTLNNRIRKVTPSGIITTFAGGGGSLGEGPATSAGLANPVGLAVDGAGNVYIADTGNSRIRKVNSAGIITTVTGNGDEAFAGDGGPAAGAPVNLPRGVAVDGAGNIYIADTNNRRIRKVNTVGVITTVAGFGALGFSGDGGPAVNAAFNLPWGIAVDGFGNLYIADSNNQRIRKVDSAGIITTLAGNGNLGYSGDGGLATSAALAAFGVAVDGIGNVYVADITNHRIRKTPGVPALQVSPNGVVRTGVEGGSTTPSQRFAVINSGQGVMNWSLQVSTLSGGNWLSVPPSSGSSTAVAAQFPEVDLSANVAGLSAGKYSALIQVNAQGSANATQFVSVHLNVLPAGTNPGVEVEPKGLGFVATAGGPSPAAQSLRLGTARAASVTVSASATTQQGGNWLSVAPASLTISSASSGTITVQATPGPLAQGAYAGVVNLQFSDGSPAQAVNVLFLVAPAGTTTAAPGGITLSAAGGVGRGPAAACTPQKLVALDRSLGSGFSSLTGWPSSISVLVVDDCGSAVSNATVVASFSNGDNPLTLESLGNGIYGATWRPVNVASQLTATMRVSSPPLPDVQVQALGKVNDNPGVPVVFPGGVVHAASYIGQRPAPGSIVSVFGRSLGVSGAASAVPLPTTLGGASLNVGGRSMPLFYSSNGQVNAQLPFELLPNSRLNLVAKAHQEGTGPENIAAPETIIVGAVQPGIFTVSQDGKGQGVILNVGNRVVDSSAPATAGDVVVVYCAGLGATRPVVASGLGAPAQEPLARVVAAVTATVGGKEAAVQFAGLTPGFVGLYQVNVQIPTGVTAGAAVPLVLAQYGVPSNTVTLAVR